jgi:hypothetical protein
VRRAKDPFQIANLCARLGIGRPDVARDRPLDPSGWLVKTVGGAGGGHVAPAGEARGRDEDVYYQRRAVGDPASVLCLCLGVGAEAEALGASRQWSAPALGRALGLRGLASFDFVATDSDFALLEVNPRPGASLDIFDDREGLIFQAHVDACRGAADPPTLQFGAAAAAAVAYARRDIAAMPALAWPHWAADRPACGAVLRLYDPLCTVKACAASAARARALVGARTTALLDRIDRLDRGASA